MPAARFISIHLLATTVAVSFTACAAAQAQAEKPDDVQHAHDAVLSDSQRIIQNGLKQIEWHRQRADAEIAKVNGWVDEQMRDVPPVLHILGSRIATPNYEYEPTLKRVQGQAKQQISVINERFEHDKKCIEDDTQRRLQGLREADRNTITQMQPGSSGTQVTPKGSSAYVRNLVNYSDEPILVKPITAQPGVWSAPQTGAKRRAEK